MASRVFQHESLPSGPKWDDARKAIDAVAGDQLAAIRDRAILMLPAVYGVRAGEVALLKSVTAQPQKHWREDTGLLQFLRSL